MSLSVRFSSAARAFTAWIRSTGKSTVVLMKRDYQRAGTPVMHEPRQIISAPPARFEAGCRLRIQVMVLADLEKQRHFTIIPSGPSVAYATTFRQPAKIALKIPLTHQNICSIVGARGSSSRCATGAVAQRARRGSPSSQPGAFGSRTSPRKAHPLAELVGSRRYCLLRYRVG
jgi:hypothetical protein